MAFLPSGSIPYQQYINSEIPSLASHLAGLGYQTYAQHPYNADGWERNEVYPRLGFSDMDFISDYGNRRYVRKYVSDESDFAHVIRTFENRAPGKPVFIFNVTMQNHGGYTAEYSDFVNTVEMDKGSAAINQYLSLLRLTDESLRMFLDYFSKVEEPTVVVFFGDHQPADSVVRPIWRINGVDYANLTAEQQRARYQVPYLIWANYEIPEAAGVDTSLNYLAGHVLELAGVPADAYRNYLASIERSCPVISAAGQSAAEGVGEDELSDMLLAYRKLQYYQLFDYSE